MFSCQICGQQSATSVAYVRHIRIHSNIPNLVLQCCMPNCQRTFKKCAGLKGHIFVKQRSIRLVDLTCHVSSCRAKCDSLTEFYSHLKVHIKEGQTIACPFKQCDKTFTVISTFTSHLSRKHKRSEEVNLTDSVIGLAGVSGSSGPHGHGDSDLQCDVEIDAADNADHLEFSPENIEDSLFLRNLALFYLKLQAKLLLPASTIQTIIEDMQSIDDLSQSQLFSKLDEKLRQMIQLGLIDDLRAEDLFRTHNTHALKQIYVERLFSRVNLNMSNLFQYAWDKMKPARTALPIMSQ